MSDDELRKSVKRAGPKERAAQALDLIHRAHDAELLAIDVEARKYWAAPGIGNPWESLTPLLLLMLAALFAFVLAGLGFGIVALLVAVALFLGPVQWTTAARVRTRARKALLRDPDTFHRMWQHGGILLRLLDVPGIFCAAPGCDWQRFARSYLKDRVGREAGRRPAETNR